MKAELLRQKALCDGYEKQSLRNQEQMTLELKDKEKVIEKLSMETDKYKVQFVCSPLWMVVVTTKCLCRLM